jgi:hypothetical protein
MPDRDQQHTIGLLILAGVGAGALTGALIGFLASRRPHAKTHDEIGETVDDLKRRAEQILTELSQTSVAAPEMPHPV